MVAPERLGGCLQGASWLESSSLSNPSLEGKRFLELGKEEDFHPELESLDGDLDPGLPSTEDVILKTEQVTKNIQELLRAAQEFKHDRYGGGQRLTRASGVLQRTGQGPVRRCPGTLPSLALPPPPSFVPCSEKIHLAVTEMASLFPKVQGTERGAGGGGCGESDSTGLVGPLDPRGPIVARGWFGVQGPTPPQRPALEPVRSSLRLLNASAYRLQSECRKTAPPEPGAPVDFQLLTQQVIQCAYDIAKAAKQLVTITTREKKQ